MLESSRPVGRPDNAEVARRTRALLGELAAGVSPLEAARRARVKPERVLRLLGEPEFRAAFVALLDEAA